MALFVGSSWARSTLELSEAEAAFHPKWDAIEEYLVVGMLIVGLLATPTGTSVLECTTADPNATTPVRWAFVNDICTREHLETFVNFFPYVLLLGPVALILVHLANKQATSGIRRKKFYRLLVDSEEDVDKLRTKQRNIITELRSQFENSKVKS